MTATTVRAGLSILVFTVLGVWMGWGDEMSVVIIVTAFWFLLTGIGLGRALERAAAARNGEMDRP